MRLQTSQLSATLLVASTITATALIPAAIAQPTDLPAPMTTSSEFRVALLETVNQEWKFWEEQTLESKRLIKRGKRETQETYWQRVGDYWQSIGKNYTGKNTNQPWSAAFISWSMKEAGAGDDFKYSIRHSTYITDAIANRKEGRLDAPFVGYKVSEYAPQEGDLVCYSRASWVSYNTTGNYPSHCDVVVSAAIDEIEVIGGNVTNSVSKKILKVDSEGKVADTGYSWFAVLKNNL